MNQVLAPTTGVATVKIVRRHSTEAAARANAPKDLWQATVTRNGLVEWIGESLCERTLRNTLRRYGYPNTKALVPVSA